MIIRMELGCTPAQIERVVRRVEEQGNTVDVSQGTERTLIGVIGKVKFPPDIIEQLPGVERAERWTSPYKRASLEYKLLMGEGPKYSVTNVDGVKIGNGNKLALILGPCAVESEKQIMEIAEVINGIGETEHTSKPLMRACLFKPRTSPYSFRGLGIEGIGLVEQLREEFPDLKIAMEVMDPNAVSIISDVASLMWVGARNMQDYVLLDAMGRSNKPVMVKRSPSGTCNELLGSAEYVLSQREGMNGNNESSTMLCLRGIISFDKEVYRNCPDVADVAALRTLTHLPIIVDPSHMTGERNLALELALLGAASGADGLMLEVHPNPEDALSDGKQSLYPDQLPGMIEGVGQMRATYLNVKGKLLKH